MQVAKEDTSVIDERSNVIMQDKQYVMALDAGTTSNRAIIFDNESHIVSAARKNSLSISRNRAG